MKSRFMQCCNRNSKILNTTVSSRDRRSLSFFRFDYKKREENKKHFLLRSHYSKKKFKKHKL